MNRAEVLYKRSSGLIALLSARQTQFNRTGIRCINNIEMSLGLVASVPLERGRGLHPPRERMRIRPHGKEDLMEWTNRERARAFAQDDPRPGEHV